MAQNGRVTTQASMIARKTFQLTAPNWLARPVPVTAEVTTCVVDTGRPKSDASWMMIAPPTSALNPLMGWSLVIFSPSVRMRRNDRTERNVPTAMAAAASEDHPEREAVLRRRIRYTQPCWAARKITMIPMTLVASLDPWLNETQLEERICMCL